MSVIFKCDGCGRQEEGWFNSMGKATKPNHWYQRSDKDGTQVACSRRCIETVAELSGKTACVLPV